MARWVANDPKIDMKMPGFFFGPRGTYIIGPQGELVKKTRFRFFFTKIDQISDLKNAAECYYPAGVGL